MIRTILARLVFVLLVIPGVASAGGFSWTFQNTSISNNGSSVALGMRGGDVWPVIFSPEDSVALLPTGWASVGDGLVQNPPLAASSPTGEVAAWSGRAADPRLAVVSSPSGWQTCEADTVTFDDQGRLWRANDGRVSYLDAGGWNYLPDLPGETSSKIALAVSGEEVGVVTVMNGLFYYHYSPLVGSWEQSPNLLSGGTTIGNKPSLVFDDNAVPHILGVASDRAVAYDFCVQTGQWQSTNLPGTSDLSVPLPLDHDGAGTVGTAYVSGESLYYAYNTDNTTWMVTTIPAGADGSSEPQDFGVGLAYDYEGLPVVAYTGDNNVMWLAYDPIIVPEPLTAALLAVGGLCAPRRRR